MLSLPSSVLYCSLNFLVFFRVGWLSYVLLYVTLITFSTVSSSFFSPLLFYCHLFISPLFTSLNIFRVFFFVILKIYPFFVSRILPMLSFCLLSASGVPSVSFYFLVFSIYVCHTIFLHKRPDYKNNKFWLLFFSWKRYIQSNSGILCTASFYMLIPPPPVLLFLFLKLIYFETSTMYSCFYLHLCMVVSLAFFVLPCVYAGHHNREHFTYSH